MTAMGFIAAFAIVLLAVGWVGWMEWREDRRSEQRRREECAYARARWHRVVTAAREAEELDALNEKTAARAGTRTTEQRK